MKTAVEWLVQEFDLEMQDTFNHKINQANKMFEEQVIKHSLELAKILISNPYETSGKMPAELIDSYINKTSKSE